MSPFPSGSQVSIFSINADGSLTEIGSSDDFLAAAEAGEQSDCNCPPGICLGEALAGDEPSDDDFEGDDDVLFFEDEGIHPEDRLEAVAQLGRITEKLSTLANVQARLLTDLLEG